MGSRKTPGSEDLSPFTHTLPWERRQALTSSPQITAQGWGGPVDLHCGENLLFPHLWRMAGPHCFHSVTPPLLWLLSVTHSEKDMEGSFLFLLFFFGKILLLLLTWSHIVHPPSPPPGEWWQSPVSIFKWHWAFLLSQYGKFEKYSFIYIILFIFVIWQQQ